MCIIFFFFFNDTATTEIYTLSLHDALPILARLRLRLLPLRPALGAPGKVVLGWSPRSVRACTVARRPRRLHRSEEHTSELQSRQYLVCRLLLEKKNITLNQSNSHTTRLPGN